MQYNSIGLGANAGFVVEFVEEIWLVGTNLFEPGFDSTELNSSRTEGLLKIEMLWTTCEGGVGSLPLLLGGY